MNEFDIDINEIKEVLSRSSPKVEKNVTIVTQDDLKQDCVYHITMGRFNEFTPNISRRAGLSEDNTIPRIHTAPHLLGCIRGYAAVGKMAATVKPSRDNKAKGVNANYLGGFYIYRIPFRVALKPNNKLVYDASYTDEHWLIAYNELTRVYPANLIGKLVVSEVKYIPQLNKAPIEEITLVTEIDHIEGIWLNKKTKINQGFYQIKLRSDKIEVECIGITKDQYLKAKALSADMLSYKEPEAPKWLF